MDNLPEDWRAVKGYEGQYEVSGLGRVRSLDRDVPCLSRWGSPRLLKVRGRVVRPWKSTGGYLCVELFSEGTGGKFQVHRLVASAFIGEPHGKHVNHIDGDKRNNCSPNLEYVTPKENTAHAIANGLMTPIGESNPAAKCTADQIREAHAMVLVGATHGQASKAVGLPVSTIVSACLGNTWRSLGLQVIRRPIGSNQFSQPPG